MLDTYGTYNGVAFITAPKINTDVLWALSIFFIVLAVIYFLSVFFFRNRISGTARLTRQSKKELSPMISEFLFYEEDANKDEKSNYISLKIEIRELLKNDFNRKILVEVLLDLRKDVSGDTQTRLFALYQDLGLEKDAFEKLKSWHWEVVSKGILELTQMQVVSAYSFITKFINHKTGTIRKQAEIATVTLKPEGINYFLDTTRYKISEWQQLKLLDVIRNQDGFEPPRFRMWLTSKNKHVVLFSLRLIKYYNQNDANASLIELLKHKDNQIKQEAISCIKEFYVAEAIPTLKSIFKKSNTYSKIAVLGAIAEIGSHDDLGFLNEIEKGESDFLVSSKALLAINTIDPESVMPSEGIEVSKEYVAEIKEGQIKLDTTENIEIELPQVSAAAKEIEEKTGVPAIVKDFKEEDTVEESISVDSAPEELPNDVHFNTSIEQSEEEATEQIIVNTEVPEITENKTVEEKEDCEPEQIEALQVTEIIVVDPVVVSGISTKIRSPEAEIFSEPSLRFDFLPLVTNDNTHTTNHTIPKYKPMADSENTSRDIKKIEVEFDEINSIIQSDATIDKPDFDVSKIDFLPIVVEEQKVENELPESSTLDENEDLQGLINEINELNFLPIVMDNEVVDEQHVVDTTPEEVETKNTNSIDGYTLSDFEVQFEDTKNSIPEVKEEKEEISEEPSNTNQVGPVVNDSQDVISWLMAENELRENELENDKVEPIKPIKPFADLIPEPIYYNEHEAYMMGLLDDLEEMGDHREIPLLQELLAEENQSFIKDRISSLIEQFSYTQKTIKQTSSKTPVERELEMPTFNVFADLFKNVDTESKLLLLDEIVSVGDEKEITFLDGLLGDSNLEIRAKAQEVLKLLVEKVSRKTEFEKDLIPRPVGELPIDLSILEPFIETKSKKEYFKTKKTAFVPRASDTLDFDFVLEDTEVLDKKYDKKVLDIQVEANEISSNDNSFLTNIIDFPKKLIGKFNG
ncbi:HEAT repeat domain-containing protein [Zobellia barbeyronii]|uniref:HEAT repeat domain-containing protein n=1 Tax=Zobellia barbeyronii TaxID=2748009 RepID=A0ABS5WHT2_9FLAO|nr:HEAT repeat domain-containing protein [Zobellia barbeyronii]MBT2162939.1 HEAT repeat domain-containing protein [Zobellia barbeyronii]